MEMKKWFSIESSQQTPPPELIIPQRVDQNQPPSSSSSSLRSLSLSIDDSSELAPLMYINQEQLFLDHQALIRSSSSLPTPNFSATSPHHQQAAFPVLGQMPKVNQFPTAENIDAAMTNAILAVLSSSSPSTSSTSRQNLPPKPTAFRRYREALTAVAGPRMGKQNMFRRALSFFRDLSMRRSHELQIHGNQPSTAQLHHMISERKRREKLNESFEVLRSLLPPGSKKDKASVLSNTVDYLSSLRSQVSELIKRNQILEARLSNDQITATEKILEVSSLVERINVELEHVSSSTSQERFFDLRVSIRGESSMLNLISRIMEFLKTQQTVRLVSVGSNTRMAESTQVHGITLRLKIEGDEFDESSFQEAVKRAVDDLAH